MRNLDQGKEEKVEVSLVIHAFCWLLPPPHVFSWGGCNLLFRCRFLPTLFSISFLSPSFEAKPQYYKKHLVVSV
jgi:hypothetical protein